MNSSPRADRAGCFASIQLGQSIFVEERAARPTESIVKLIEETSVRFDLSPAQEAALLELARPRPTAGELTADKP